jgi:type I restriction enzyme S subunit
MQLVPLRELLALSDSGVWGDEDIEAGISVLRSTNIKADGTIDYSDLSFRSIEENKRIAKRLQSGDILIEKSGGGPKQPVGRVALFHGHAREHTFGNFIARLRPKECVLSEYLFYFLWHFHAKGGTNHYQKQTTGIRNLEFSRYLGILVPIVPLPLQREVVEALSQAEGISRLRREAARKADELLPATFLDMFGDPVSNPKRLPIRCVSDFVRKFEGGKNLQAGDDGTTEYRILKVSAVTSGTYRESESKPTPNDYVAPSNHVVRAGDMLFSRANTVELVGATALVESTNGKTLLPDKLWRFVWAEEVAQHFSSETIYARSSNCANRCSEALFPSCRASPRHLSATTRRLDQSE